MYTSKIRDYEILYPNKIEFKNLKKEIFDQEIYNIDLKKNNPQIIDIGAYIGISTIYFKDKYPDADIKIFEPNPNIFPILEDNIIGNGLNNIEMFNTAIDKKECIKDFYIDNTGQEWFSTSSFNKNAWNGKQNSTPIKVQTEILSKYIINNIDLIKIDTEGNELNILKEIKPKLDLIKNLIIEYHPTKKQKIINIEKILISNNYHLEYIYEGNIIKKGIEELLIIKAIKQI